MIGTYDPVVVALSVLIAVVAGYTALDIATRIRAEGGRRRVAWLLGGSMVMGIGIWSMHFVGMLAFHLPGAEERYDVPLTAASAVIAIAASALALLVVSRERRRWALAIGGLLFGLAISSMHYTGMAAMRVPAQVSYDPLPVALSIAIAIGAAWCALWIMFRLRSDAWLGLEPLKMAGGVLLGFAIVGMHYTGMAAAEFSPVATPTTIPSAAVLGTDELTALVVISSLAVLGLALIAAAADRGRRLLVLEQARREGAESAQERVENILDSITDLFIALERDWRLTYVNARAAEFFGRPREEMIGALLGDVAPGFEGSAFQQHFERALAENVSVTFQAESVVAPGQWIEAHAHPSGDGLSVYFRNITERRQAEQALKASEERYRQLFERSPIGVYRSTPAGELLAANPAMVQMLGYDSFEELTAYNIAEVGYASPEDRYRFRDIIEREGEVEGFEAIWLRRDGTELYVRENARPIREEDGTILYFQGAIEDVTARRQAEEALRREKEFSASLIASSQDGILSFDREFRYTVWNPAMERMTGLSANRVLGRNAFEVFPFLRETGEDASFRAVLEGRSVEGEDRPYNVPGTERSGYFKAHYSPIRDAEGEVVGGLAIVRDTTERKKVDEALRNSEERFRSFTERSSDMVTVIDPDGTITYQSPSSEHVLGYPAPEMIGANAFSFVLPEDVPATMSVFEQALESPADRFSAEFRFRHRDGGWRVLQAQGRNLLDDPAVGGVLVNSRDITDWRALEGELIQSQKMDAVGQLAGGIAHDFNNILTSIQGHAQLILQDIGDHDPIVDYAREIEKGAERGSSLTRQLLTFSRHEIVQPTRLDLNEVVREMEDMLRRLIRADIDFAVDLTDTEARITADRGQTQQVVLNLALNARDAMADGGALRIVTRRVDIEGGQVVTGGARSDGYRPVSLRPGSYTALRVEDTGHGIDAETLEHIFEPFFTTKEQGAGTGLGLSTVHGIVEQSGGAIDVQTEPGVGTTFTVYLPSAEELDEQDGLEEQHPAADDARVPVETGEAPTATVLVVEDEPSVRSLASKVLARQGYRVLEAENGRSALRIAEEHDGRLDLVLTDVVMPEMDGRELGEKLRESRPETIVVYMSGYTRDEVLRRGIFRSEVPFLEKPFSPARLLSIVQDSLGLAAT